MLLSVSDEALLVFFFFGFLAAGAGFVITYFITTTSYNFYDSTSTFYECLSKDIHRNPTVLRFPTYEGGKLRIIFYNYFYCKHFFFFTF